MNNVKLLKNNLITRIQNSADLDFLKMLQSVFNKNELELFELNEVQKKSVQISKNEFRNGEYIEHSQAISNLKEWLQKK